MRLLVSDVPNPDPTSGMAKKEKAGPGKPRPENIPIGNRIREARDRAKLSQSDLGKRIGVESQSVSKYERGVMKPDSDALVAMERVLGVSASWIMTGEASATATTLVPEHVDSPAWLQLEAEGVIDDYRRRGVPEDKIQHTRTIPGFRGGLGAATREEYLAHLDADLLGAVKAGSEPPEFTRARDEVEREGGPDLAHHLRPKKDR